jgi:hypothetical protein
MPNIEDDAVPMANLIKSRQPNILTVALDPEGTGPDTHYKVLLVRLTESQIISLDLLLGCGCRVASRDVSFGSSN